MEIVEMYWCNRLAVHIVDMTISCNRCRTGHLGVVCIGVSQDGRFVMAWGRILRL